jgi:hypothetical protein
MLSGETDTSAAEEQLVEGQPDGLVTDIRFGEVSHFPALLFMKRRDIRACPHALKTFGGLGAKPPKYKQSQLLNNLTHFI